MTHRLWTTVLVSLSLLAPAACANGAATSSTSSPSSSPASTRPASAGSASAGSASASATSTSSAGLALSRPSSQLSYEGIPLQLGTALAPADTTGTAPVEGIRCAPVEQLVYHIHAHLAVFAAGKLYSLPGGVGIPGSTVEQSQQGPVAVGGHCYYWLHTHTPDGVIHIESPVPRIYTLGNFFDEWHQPLGPARVGDLHGTITAFVDGKPWKRSLRAIRLLPHAEIQLNIGEPTPPLVSVTWAGTGL